MAELTNVRILSFYEPEPQGSKWGNRLGASIDSYQAGLYGFGEALTDSDWMRERRIANERDAAWQREQAARQGAISSYKDVDSVGDALDYLGGLAVDSLPYLAEAAAGGWVARGLMTGTRAALAAARTAEEAAAARRALNVGSTIGGVAASYPSAVGDILQNQRDQSDETNLGSALVGGVPYAAANAVGLTGALSRGTLRSAIGGSLRNRVAANAGLNALAEGGAETFQEGVNQYFGRMAVDPDETFWNDKSKERFADSFVGGAALGGVFGGVSGIRKPIDEFSPRDLLKNDQEARPATDVRYEPPEEVADLAGAINPFNVAGYVDTLMRGGDTTLVEPGALAQRGLFGNMPFDDDPPTVASVYTVDPAAATPSASDATGASASKTKGGEKKAKATVQPANKPKVFSAEEELLISHGVSIISPKKVELVAEIANRGLDPDSDALGPFWTALAENKLGNARKTLASAIAEANAASSAAVPQPAAPVQPSVLLPSQPASLPATAPAVVGASSTQGVVSGAQAPQAQQASPQKPQTPAPATSGTAISGTATSGQAPVTVNSLQRSADESTEPRQETAAEAWDKEYTEEADGDPKFADLSDALKELWVSEFKATKTPQRLANKIIEKYKQAKDEWDDNFTYGVEHAPKFNALSGPLKDVWVSKVAGNQATIQLANDIIERQQLEEKIDREENELSQLALGSFGEQTVRIFKQILEGKTHEEIAEAERVSRETVTMAAANAKESIRRLTNALSRSGNRERVEALLGSLSRSKERVKELDEKLGIADSSYGRDIDVADFVAGLLHEIDSPNQTKTDVGVVGKNAKNKGEKADNDPVVVATEQNERWIELQEEINSLKRRLSTAADKTEIEHKIAALEKRQAGLEKQAKATGRRLVASLVTKEDSAKGGEDAEVKPLTGDYEDLKVVHGVGVDEDVDGGVDASAGQTAEGGEYFEGDEAFEAGTDKPAENPYKAKQLYDELRKFVRSDALGRKVIVVDSVAEILKLPDPEAVLVAEMFIKKPNAYGLAFGGRKAYLIASRINKGEGRAKFLHEVGVHLGLENILTEGQINTLSSQVEHWAKAGDGSLESSLAQKAVARVNAAGTEAKARKHELIAYFVEEAVLAGVDPVAASSNLSGRLLVWLRTVWAAFKRAVRKLGIKPESLTAQDFVDLAYGAARLEITGAWHGTTASFRKFSNEFVGSRIGTVFGWGTYFTQSKKEATGYSNQKNKAGLDTKLYAVDLAVNENNTFDYDLPVAKQNGFVRRKMVEALKQAGIAESEIDSLTGEDIIGKGRVGLLGKAIEAGAEPKNPSPEFKQAVEEGDYRKATSLFLKAHGIVASKHRSENSRMNVEVNGRLMTPADIDEDIRTVLTSLHTGEYTEQQARTYLAKLEVIDLASRKGIKGAEEVLRIDVKYAPTEQDKAESLQKLQWFLRSKTSVDETSGFYNIVVFDDSRIIRAADTTNNDKNTIRFGINGSTQAPRSTVEKTLAKLPASVRPSVRNVWMALKEYSSRGLDKVVFTADLLDRAVKAGIDSAMEYKNLMVERGVKAREHELAAEKIADMYNEIPTAEEARAANALARESTRLGKWAYQPSWMKPVKVDPDLNTQWEQLGEEAQAWIDAMFKFEHETLLRKKKAVLENTTTVYDSIIKAAEDALNNSDLSREEIEAAKRDIEQAKRSKVSELAKFARLFDTWAGMPYLPLKRFGRFAVVAKSKEYVEAEANDDRKLLKELQKSEDHYYVDFVDDLFEANTLKEKLQAEFDGSVESFEREQFDNLYGSEGLLATMSRLRNIIDSQPTEDKIDRTALRRMQSIVSEMYLQALAESSARKSEMRRKGVAGDIDMLKSFATQGKANAHFLAAVEYNERIQDALNKMRREARRAGANRLRASALLNEIMKRYNQTLDYEPSNLTKKITRLTSVWFLANSPAYYIQNLTQPFMMSVPMMAGRHGWTQAANAQQKAYADLKELIKTGKALSEFDFSKVPADVKEAVDFLVRRGLIDIGLDTELGEFQIDASSKLKAGWNKVDKFLRISTQKMEAINRLSTAIAAYRLELAKTGSKKAAVEYAAQVINDTHGDYTAFNAPRAFNTNLGKIALQFRKFQLIQLTYLAKLLKDAGFSTPEKRAATAALLFTLGHTVIMAGLRGLPGYAAIAWAAGALFGDDDEPFDLTQWLRQQIGNDDVANLILRGAPTIVGADMSGKIGMGNALSILPFTDVDLLDRRSTAEALGTLVGGASFGLAQRMAEGIALISNGDYYKGLEMLLPKGISDAMKAYRYADEGVTRRNGDVTIRPEDLSGLEVFFQMLGVPVAQINVRGEKQQYVKETTDKLAQAAARIKNAYTKAYREKDYDAMEEARQDWRKLQDTRRKMGLKSQPLSELLKAPREQAKRERNTINGVQFNDGNKGLVESLV